MKLQGLTVSVCYDDLLRITLPRNLAHLSSQVIITAPFDQQTVRAVEEIRNIVTGPTALTFTATDRFYRDGATFNKFGAVEDETYHLNQNEWVLVWDADIVFPKNLLAGLMNLTLDRDCLYSVRRYQVDSPEDLAAAWDATTFASVGLRELPDEELAGYFHLWHPASIHLKTRPWYGPNWKHAGGGDSDFMAKFPPAAQKWLDFPVLHLGQAGTNWYGRVTSRWDKTAPSVGPVTAAEAKHQQAQMQKNRGRDRNDRYKGERIVRG